MRRPTSRIVDALSQAHLLKSAEQLRVRDSYRDGKWYISIPLIVCAVGCWLRSFLLSGVSVTTWLQLPPQEERRSRLELIVMFPKRIPVRCLV